MKAVFVETVGFTRQVVAELPDDVYAEVQRQLMNDSEAGAVMPGCGGLRKMRVADSGRGKGKRSGGRLIYLHVPEAKQFLLLDLYRKGEQEDLTTEERRFLKEVAQEFKAAAIASARRTNQ